MKHPVLVPLLIWAAASAPLGALGLPIKGAIAQTPPAETFQPGPWQPLGRINPDRQVDIRLVNQSGLTVEYSPSLNAAAPQILPAGRTAQMIDVAVPSFVLVNAANPQETLWYDIQVDEGANTVIVEIQRIDDPAAGYTTLNVHETGAIYAY